MGFFESLMAASQNSANQAASAAANVKQVNEWNPFPSFMQMIAARKQMANANDAKKRYDDYYNSMQTNPYGNKGGGGGSFNPQQAQMVAGPSISVGEIPHGGGGDSWGQILGAVDPNFQEPTGGNPQAQALVGDQSPQQFNDKMNLRQWLEYDNKVNGVNNVLASAERYKMFMEPLTQRVEQDELRNAYFTLNNDLASPKDKLDAMSLIEYYKQNPFLEEEYQYKIGNKPNIGFGDGDDSEYVGEYANGGQVYSYLKSKGLPDNVIAAMMGNFQQESSFNGDAVGDNGLSLGLAQWHKERGDALRNFATQRGQEWNHLPTQMDYLLDEINNNYPNLLKELAGMDPYNGALYFHKIYERSNDTPEQAAQRGKNADAIFKNRRIKPRYIKDNSRLTNKEMADYRYAQQNALSDKKFQQQVALAQYKQSLKNNGNKNGTTSSSKTSQPTNYSFHGALESLADIDRQYSPEIQEDEKKLKAHKESFSKAQADIKKRLIGDEGLTKYIEQSIQQGVPPKEIGLQIASKIKSSYNTNLHGDRVADIVEDLLIDFDPRVSRGSIAPDIAQRLRNKVHTTYSDKQGRANSYGYVGAPRYFDAIGMTDEELRAGENSRNPRAYAQSVSSQARAMGNQEYAKNNKTKQDNRTEIEKLADEVWKHKNIK